MKVIRTGARQSVDVFSALVYALKGYLIGDRFMSSEPNKLV